MNIKFYQISKKFLQYFKTKIQVHLFIILGVIIFTSCFLENFNKHAEISQEELVGRWVLTQKSLESMRLENNNYVTSKLELEIYDNGTFKLINMPDCWINEFGECRGNVYSFDGKWKLWRANENSDFTLMLDLNNFNRVSSMSITKDGGLFLGFRFGDPDLGRSFFLVKES